MAEYKHQVQDLRAGLQHLANLNQEASATPAALVHQHQAALAVGLVHQHQAQVLHQHQVGAQPQYQAAVIAVQDLERQRLQKLSQDSAENPPL